MKDNEEADMLPPQKHLFYLKRVDSELFIARVESLQQQVSLPPLTDEFLKQAKEMGRP